MVLRKIHSLAKEKLARIAFDEINDERIVKAVKIISEKGIARPVLIGSSSEISKYSNDFGVDLTGFEYHNPSNFPDYNSFAKILFEKRKKKGMTLDSAYRTIQDKMSLAMLLLHDKRIDGIVSGASKPTSEVIRPAIQIVGMEEGISTVSSYFHMIKGKHHVLFADCAINQKPNYKQLADIAISTYDSAKQLGIDPRVAMLSYSTYRSANHPSVQKVIDATNLVREIRPDIFIDGEIQFDAATDPVVAKQKCPQSPLKGNANVLIFPNLNTGNISYKVARTYGGYGAIGPVTQGLRAPVNDLSRGCSVEEVVDLAAITASQSKR